jgi:hypothetical protein
MEAKFGDPRQFWGSRGIAAIVGGDCGGIVDERPGVTFMVDSLILLYLNDFWCMDNWAEEIPIRRNKRRLRHHASAADYWRRKKEYHNMPSTQ